MQEPHKGDARRKNYDGEQAEDFGVDCRSNRRIGEKEIEGG